MRKFVYFGNDVPREIEREYNRMLRQEQYQIEKDIAHGVSTLDYDPLLHNVADRSLTQEFQLEAETDRLWNERLTILPIAMDWLKIEYPDEYKLINAYYFADKPVTLMYLAERYGVTKQALSKRIAAVRDKLRKFIIAHENKL